MPDEAPVEDPNSFTERAYRVFGSSPYRTDASPTVARSQSEINVRAEQILSSLSHRDMLSINISHFVDFVNNNWNIDDSQMLNAFTNGVPDSEDTNNLINNKDLPDFVHAEGIEVFQEDSGGAILSELLETIEDIEEGEILLLKGTQQETKYTDLNSPNEHDRDGNIYNNVSVFSKDKLLRYLRNYVQLDMKVEIIENTKTTLRFKHEKKVQVYTGDTDVDALRVSTYIISRYKRL